MKKPYAYGKDSFRAAENDSEDIKYGETVIPNGITIRLGLGMMRLNLNTRGTWEMRRVCHI
jgi:hypothetical protein